MSIPTNTQKKAAHTLPPPSVREVIKAASALDEQGGPFVTIAAEHWQPREYETETVTVRKPKGAK